MGSVQIEVERLDDTNFKVVVREGGSQTEHRVSFDDEYYSFLTSGIGSDISKEHVIKASFEFLLEREPKESILSSFDMRVISRYFPEYEGEIRGRI